MKQYIRDILNDLHKAAQEDFIPEIPKAPAGASTVYLDPPKSEAIPSDLNNQEPSPDSAERVKQLDYQAQKDEERQRLG